MEKNDRNKERLNSYRYFMLSSYQKIFIVTKASDLFFFHHSQKLDKKINISAINNLNVKIKKNLTQCQNNIMNKILQLPLEEAAIKSEHIIMIASVLMFFEP